MIVGDNVNIMFAGYDPEAVYTVVRVNEDGTVGVGVPGYDDPEYPGADFAPEYLRKV